MTELTTIKKLSQTQLLIMEALKSAPPLKITKPSKDKDFVVFDDQNRDNKPNNSLMDRFIRHKAMNANNCALNESPTKRKTSSDYKWSHLKNSLTQELETKRMESQKVKEMNEKLENEELDEEEDELTAVVDEDIDENEDNGKASDCDSNEDKSDAEVNDNSDEEVNDDSEDNDCNDSEEDDSGSDRELNPFIEDEAEDDDKEEEETDEQFDTNSVNCSQNKKIISEKDSNLLEIRTNGNDSQQKSQTMADEECNDNALNDSLLNTSVNSMDESFDNPSLCATQKIAFSPFVTQKVKSRLNPNQTFPELMSKTHSNVEEFDSQTLLGLCSGIFSQNNSQNEVKTEDTPKNVTEDGLKECDEEEEEVMSGTKKIRKVFNVESDDESDAEDMADNDLKEDIQSLAENTLSLKNFNESDGEELVVTEAEESNGEEADEEEGLRHDTGRSFFDDEAELSGSEVSSDEDEDNGEDDYVEETEEAEELPSESELKDQIGRFHNKNLLDEDKRQLLIMKEMLFEDGDLHEDGKARQKKFRWNFEGDDNFHNDYINEDSDDNYMDSDDDTNTKTPALKMSDKNLDNSSTNTVYLDKLKTKLNLRFNLKDPNKKQSLDSKKVNSLASFVVRDERLKQIISKRTVSTTVFKANKRFKSSAKNKSKPSVFDLINQI